MTVNVLFVTLYTIKSGEPTRLEVSRNNPPLKFIYGQGADAEQISPAENLKRRKKGGTPIKLARQRVIARCVRELFKELCAIAKI
jgi:hypothetical protein